MTMEALPFGLGGFAHTTSPIEASRTFGEALPHFQETFRLSAKIWGQVSIFP